MGGAPLLSVTVGLVVRRQLDDEHAGLGVLQTLLVVGRLGGALSVQHEYLDHHRRSGPSSNGRGHTAGQRHNKIGPRGSWVPAEPWLGSSSTRPRRWASGTALPPLLRRRHRRNCLSCCGNTPAGSGGQSGGRRVHQAGSESVHEVDLAKKPHQGQYDSFKAIRCTVMRLLYPTGSHDKPHDS